MSRLSDATTKLESAVDRLETAIAKRAALPGGDRESLQATIDRVRQENATLKQSVANSTTRLDVAIARLRALLGD